MSVDYNSKLIARLYEEPRDDIAAEICDEMVEIGDPIFIQPIFSAYKRFKSGFYSHYFLGDLANFKTPETAEIFKSLSQDEEIHESDLTDFTDYFSEIEYYEDSFTNRIVQKTVDFLLTEDDSDFRLSSYLSYLLKAGAISRVEDFLKDSFEHEGNRDGIRRVSLQYLLKINAKKYLQSYFDSYKDLVGKRGEILFVSEIRGWSNGIIPQLWDKVLKEGSTRARELIQEKIDKQTNAQAIAKEENKKAIESRYTNADVVADIARLRIKINTLTSTDSRFGTPIFPPSELISQQNEAAQNKLTLVGYCMDLRTILQSFETKITSSEFSEEEIKKVIPDVVKLDGSINKFHIFLDQIGINTPEDIWGLRSLNKIVSKLAHPSDTDEELISLLKLEKIDGLYIGENWPEVHRLVLEKYRNVLSAMHAAFLEGRNNETTSLEK